MKFSSFNLFLFTTLILVAFLFSLSLTSSAIVKQEWKVTKFDGPEKDLYSISKLTDNKICISMNNKDLSSVSKGEDKINYPSSLNIYEGSEKKLKESRTLTSKSKVSLGKNQECFDLDKSKGKYQIGDNSIVVELTNSYSVYSVYSDLDGSCSFNGYSITGNLTDANLTLKFNSGSDSFYSPVLFGNITLNDYLSGTTPITPSPFTGTRNCFAYNYLKPIGNCTR